MLHVCALKGKMSFRLVAMKGQSFLCKSCSSCFGNLYRQSGSVDNDQH